MISILSGGFATPPGVACATRAPRFSALRSLLGGPEEDDGVPGAAKNTGGGALANFIPPLKGQGGERSEPGGGV